MSDESLDLFEEQFWSEVESLAKELGVTTRYIEEEFIIDGELQYPGTPTSRRPGQDNVNLCYRTPGTPCGRRGFPGIL